MSSIYCSNAFNTYSLFTYFESESLSKQRIIQKNLVHFLGFPDRLYDKDLLASNEYFGQYGLIYKIILTTKNDKNTNKKLNSAYITFSTNEEAAYAILSVDSIIIDDILVRAFFGTTKYCNHFLNNLQCSNMNKCIFLHEMAQPCDIIEENSRFGYSDHIKLAKKIITFGSKESQNYVMNNSYKGQTFLPNLATIYQKNMIIEKTKNHQKKVNKNNINISIDSQNSSNSFYSNNSNIELNDNKDNSIKNEENNNIIFKSKNKSRFEFANNNINKSDTKGERNKVSKIVREIIGELTLRFAFFCLINKQIPLKNLEIEFCKNLYNKTKNSELKDIITNCI